MSCHLLNIHKVAQLADFIASVCNHGFNYFGFDCPNELSSALSDCLSNGWISESRVFDKLIEHNLDAYMGRYTEYDRDSLVPDMPDMPSLIKPKNSVYQENEKGGGSWRTVIHPWHYKALKLLQSYNYQLCEDATIDTPLYKALTELEHIIALFIVQNQPEYISAEWG